MAEGNGNGRRRVTIAEAASVERRIGPPDRRTKPRVEDGWPGRRLADHLRAAAALRCSECGRPYHNAMFAERFEPGGLCLRCRADLRDEADDNASSGDGA